MGIITSIYETTGAFTIQIKDTNNCLLMRGGEVDSIAYIETVNEIYNENTDCKIFSQILRNIKSAQTGLSIQGVICFEFMDKHVVIKLKDIRADYVRSEYTFIPKEMVTEIKGGIYEVEKILMDSMN